MKNQQLVVAAAQMKFRDSVAGNLSHITATIAAAARQGADVILFPECAVTGYHGDFGRISRVDIEAALKVVAHTARATQCHVLVGSPTFSGGKRFNSLVVFDRRGRKVFSYSKIHLTAHDARVFAPGNQFAVFRLDGVCCTAIICHERRFPELVRLPSGGWLIDTPGVRAVSLWSSGRGIERAFADVFELMDHCRFRDCKHEDEPGCTVQDAIAAGTLDPLRLSSMKRLVAEELALEEEQRAQLKAQDRRGVRKVRVK